MTRLYVSIIVITVIIVIAICVAGTRANGAADNEFTEYFKPDRMHDTIYFRVIDEFGVKSYLHDSGIKLHKDIPNQFDLNIIKKEFNDGNIQELGHPRLIMYGRRITDLNHEYKVDARRVKDKGLYYVVNVRHNAL